MSAPADRRRLLVLFAHPAFERSRVQRVLLETARGIDGVTVHDLYEAYPELDIDVAREQALLVEHDVVVLQHPLYWYSTPSILKEWQDLVLQHGWAYGAAGTALRDKLLLQALSAGGPESSYRRDGGHGHTVRDFLAPVEATAGLCGMRYLEPFVVYGTHGLGAPAIERHAAAYRRRLEALRDGEETG